MQINTSTRIHIQTSKLTCICTISQKCVERAYTTLLDSSSASSSSKKSTTPGHTRAAKPPPLCHLKAGTSNKSSSTPKTPSSKTPAKTASKSPVTPTSTVKEREGSILTGSKRNRKKTERLSPTVCAVCGSLCVCTFVYVCVYTCMKFYGENVMGYTCVCVCVSVCMCTCMQCVQTYICAVERG
jgi:hypothetical protein